MWESEPNCGTTQNKEAQNSVWQAHGDPPSRVQLPICKPRESPRSPPLLASEQHCVFGAEPVIGDRRRPAPVATSAGADVAIQVGASCRADGRMAGA